MKEVAGTNYVAVFDIGGQSSNLLFASEKYDKSGRHSLVLVKNLVQGLPFR